MKLLLLTMIFVLGNERLVHATWCAGIEYFVKKDFDSAKALFLGVAEDSWEADTQQPPSIKTKFKVIQDFKGYAATYEVIVPSNAFKLYRDTRFKTGRAYLVIAAGKGASLFTDLCTSAELRNESELKDRQQASTRRAIQWLQVKTARPPSQ